MRKETEILILIFSAHGFVAGFVPGFHLWMICGAVVIINGVHYNATKLK